MFTEVEDCLNAITAEQRFNTNVSARCKNE